MGADHHPMLRFWTLRFWTLWRSKGPSADTSTTIESISRSLWQWLLPYSVVWALFCWRVLDWPTSGMPLGPGIDFPREAWTLLLALELAPVLALMPAVWRLKLVHAIVGLAILLTMANDLMFFCQTLVKKWSLLVFLTSVLSVLKAGFDLWVFCRLNERRDIHVSGKKASSTS